MRSSPVTLWASSLRVSKHQVLHWLLFSMSWHGIRPFKSVCTKKWKRCSPNMIINSHMKLCRRWRIWIAFCTVFIDWHKNQAIIGWWSWLHLLFQSHSEQILLVCSWQKFALNNMRCRYLETRKSRLLFIREQQLLYRFMLYICELSIEGVHISVGT